MRLRLWRKRPSRELVEVRRKREAAEREHAQVTETLVTLREIRQYNHVTPRIARLIREKEQGAS